MFHLQAGIHFHKVKRTVRGIQKLHSTGAFIVDGLRGPDGGFTHGLASVSAEPRCRRLFQHFLVATLHRAVPFGQIDAVALPIAEHLNFHMTGLNQVTLEQDIRVGKGACGLALGGGQGVIEVGHVFHHPHTFAATTGNGLEQQREAACLGLGP